MEFENHTVFASELLRHEQEEGHLYAMVFIRCLFDVGRGSSAAPKVLAPDEQPLDIRRSLKKVDEIDMQVDGFFPPAGTDVIVLADAVAPKDTVVSTLDCSVSVCRAKDVIYSMPMRVFGRRTWQKTDGKKLVMSEPEPFERIALGLRNAYGGEAKTDFGAMPFSDNPLGKGFCLDAEAADDIELPSIEDPEHLISSWKDQPPPVAPGPYPNQWGLRVKAIAAVDAEAKTAALDPTRGVFDQAHPKLSGKQLKPGDRIVTEGLSATGSRAVVIPECPAHALITLGKAQYRKTLAPSEIILDLRENRLAVAYRYLFDYLFVAHHERRVDLVPGTPEVVEGSTP